MSTNIIGIKKLEFGVWNPDKDGGEGFDFKQIDVNPYPIQGEQITVGYITWLPLKNLNRSGTLAYIKNLKVKGLKIVKIEPINIKIS